MVYMLKSRVRMWKNIRTKLKLIKPEYLVLVFALLLSFSVNMVVRGENQFSLLSKQFLEGKLYLPGVVGDAVLYEGRYYWPLGPFPALLTLPFSLFTLPLFSVPMPHGILNFLMVLAILFLITRISLKFGFSKDGGLWVSTAVVFASVFIVSALMPWSWYFSQTIAFLFGLLALDEYAGKNRVFLIGLYHSFMFMTRFTSGFGILFYVLSTFLSKHTIKKKLHRLVLMSIPVVFAGVLLLSYNYARFHNAFDNGYTTANNWETNYNFFSYESINYGLFSLMNIPTNLYYYFINVPAPVLETVEGFKRNIFKTEESMIVHLVPPYIKVNSPGVSFFVVSPIFLLIFKNKLKSKNSRLALITSGFILIFLLTYYWTGWTQVGPRYMIDLLPFLLILFLESFDLKKISLKQKIIISMSALFNVYLFFSVYSKF
jgi:hypothetical protein